MIGLIIICKDIFMTIIANTIGYFNKIKSTFN